MSPVSSPVRFCLNTSTFYSFWHWYCQIDINIKYTLIVKQIYVCLSLWLKDCEKSPLYFSLCLCKLNSLSYFVCAEDIILDNRGFFFSLYQSFRLVFRFSGFNFAFSVIQWKLSNPRVFQWNFVVTGFWWGRDFQRYLGWQRHRSHASPYEWWGCFTLCTYLIGVLHPTLEHFTDTIATRVTVIANRVEPGTEHMTTFRWLTEPPSYVEKELACLNWRRSPGSHMFQVCFGFSVSEDLIPQTYRTGRRSVLPRPKPDVGDISLWSLLCKNIGKDLSKISMPVTLNEPLNVLQVCMSAD